MLLDLNQNSQPKGYLLQAAAHFQLRNYTNAIECYIQALKDPSLAPTTQILIESAIAVLYIHLNDYSHAHRILTDLSLRIATTSTGNVLQQALIAIKVEASLALIQLANLNCEHVYRHIDTLLSRVSQWQNTSANSSSTRKLLFESAMKILFGFQSFSALTAQSQLYTTNVLNSSGDTFNQIPGNEIWVLSLAINRQMTGDLQTAYQLSHRIFEACKSRTLVIPMTIACRHLLHLSQKLNLSRTIVEVYQNEFNRLMNTPQLYGISGQTLFRNFEQKIECGANVAQIMSDYESKMAITNIQNERWLNKAVIFKLKSHLMQLLSKQNINPSQSVTAEISLLKKIIQNLSSNEGTNKIIKFMGDNELIRDIHKHYQHKLHRFASCLQNSLRTTAWKVLVMLPPRLEEQFTEEGELCIKSTPSQEEDRSEYPNNHKQESNRNIDYNTLMKRQKESKISIDLNSYAKKSEKPPRSTKSPKRAPKREMASVISKSPIRHHEGEHNGRYQHLSAYMNPGNQVYLEKQAKQYESPLNSMMGRKNQRVEDPEQRARNTAHFAEQTPITHQQQPRTQHPRVENSRTEHSKKNQGKSHTQNFKQALMETSNSRLKKPKQSGSEGEQPESDMIKMVMVDSKVKKSTHIRIMKKEEEPEKQKEDHHQKMEQTSALNVQILPRHPPQPRQPIKKSSSKMISHSKLTTGSNRMKKIMKMCHSGQYFIKRHFSSDGGEEKFVQLSSMLIKWAVDQDKINTRFQSYKLKDIKGVAYGRVSETFLKECNKKLEPWKCFSLILQKRTLDFYCTQEIDTNIWLPGITASLEGQLLPSPYGQVPITLYTPGRVLWKRMLMKMQQIYLKPHKKQNKKYRNANAYAIILFGRSSKDHPPTHSHSKSKGKMF